MWAPNTSKVVPVEVAPISCTASGTTAVGLLSPQPPIGRVAVTSETVASGLGSVNVPSTIVPVLMPSIAPNDVRRLTPAGR